MMKILLAVVFLVVPIQGSSQKSKCSETSAEEHLRSGEVYFSYSQFAKAELEFRCAIESRRGVYPQAWEWLSDALQKELRFFDVESALKASIKQSPKVDHTLDIEKAKVLHHAGELKLLVDDGPPILDQILEMTDFAAQFGSREASLKYADMAMRYFPNSSAANFKMAEVMSHEPDQDAKRLVFLKRAIELDPGNARAHSYLGWFYLFNQNGSRSENLVNSIAEFELSLSLVDTAYASQGLSTALLFQGRKDEASRVYAKCLTANPGIEYTCRPVGMP